MENKKVVFGVAIALAIITGIGVFVYVKKNKITLQKDGITGSGAPDKVVASSPSSSVAAPANVNLSPSDADAIASKVGKPPYSQSARDLLRQLNNSNYDFKNGKAVYSKTIEDYNKRTNFGKNVVMS